MRLGGVGTPRWYVGTPSVRRAKTCSADRNALQSYSGGKINVSNVVFSQAKLVFSASIQPMRYHLAEYRNRHALTLDPRAAAIRFPDGPDNTGRSKSYYLKWPTNNNNRIDEGSPLLGKCGVLMSGNQNSARRFKKSETVFFNLGKVRKTSVL